MVKLQKAAQGFERAERMLGDLAGHAQNEVDFKDRLPYVLDLLAGVTRTINAESDGMRTTDFGQWWPSVNDAFRKEIVDMRNAELKRLESRSRLFRGTATSVQAVDYPDMLIVDGDSVTGVVWHFDGGLLDGKPVLSTLERYLTRLRLILSEAETKLTSLTG